MALFKTVEVGDVVGGRFEILGALGSGYFSTIYGALDRFGKAQSHFAVKIACRADFNFVLAQEKENLQLLSAEDPTGSWSVSLERRGKCVCVEYDVGECWSSHFFSLSFFQVHTTLCVCNKHFFGKEGFVLPWSFLDLLFGISPKSPYKWRKPSLCVGGKMIQWPLPISLFSPHPRVRLRRPRPPRPHCLPLFLPPISQTSPRDWRWFDPKFPI